MVAIDDEAKSPRRVNVTRIQVLVYPNVRIPRSMALDADGVRFFVQISVENGIRESRIVWPEKSRPVKFLPEMEE